MVVYTVAIKNIYPPLRKGCTKKLRLLYVCIKPFFKYAS